MAQPLLGRSWFRDGSSGVEGPSAAGVFPWMGPASIAIALLGASLAVGHGWLTHQGGVELVIRGFVGAVAGILIGAFLSMIRAIPLPGRSSTPDVDAPDLWDKWLDDEDDESVPAEAGPDLVAGTAIVPERARVRPRVLSPETGESLPLEDEVWPRIEAGECGAIRLVGAIGAGKTTALRHLASVLSPLARASLLEDPAPGVVAERARRGLVVYAANESSYPKDLATYRLAPWGDDELLEYLMGGDRDRCASVMARLRGPKADRGLLRGVPDLWRAVLDRMAADESVTNVRQALRIELGYRLADPELRRSIEDDCLQILLVPDSLAPRRGCSDEDLSRLVRHRPVQLLLAAERMAARLAGGESCEFLAARLARDLVGEVVPLALANPAVLERLRQILAANDLRLHAMAASLLHATRTGWRPVEAFLPQLSGAYLEGASWAGIVLSGAGMAGVDLGDADLSGAVLDRAALMKACLVRANLRDASLDRVDARGADLSLANLSSSRARHAHFEEARLVKAKLEEALLFAAGFEGADLSGARLSGANLMRANLCGARIDGADFTGAVLSEARLQGLKLSVADFAGARFNGAMLDRCDLEGMELPDAHFEDASLRGALLTGSTMPGATFRRASLRDAGLAEGAGARAHRRQAAIAGASLPTGTSRSGLVGSPIACEGSRTGFYTDDYHDQDYKSPEEIRKANLRGADLTGAKIGSVDFYLVDLRGARYDSEQADHLRRCRAILESRA